MNMFRAFMELDKLNEAYYSRQELINNLKSIGRNYKFDKYTDEQLYYIWQKESAKAHKKVTVDIPAESRTVLYCDECGTQLTDGGFCPVCDDGADLDECALQEADTKSLYICSECGFETELSDNEFDGCCPNCHDHQGGFGKCEEFVEGLFMTESLFDIIKDDAKYTNWISRTVTPNSQTSQSQPMQQSNISTQSNSTPPPQPQPVSKPSVNNKIVTIIYDTKAHKLRARADDGVHGEANVAFPNALRNREGQQYEVDELVWNGKNYRAVGNITAI